MTDPSETASSGAFELRTPLDLYYKLDRELRRMHAAPDDPDVAFNFFVTAWHLLDWLHPGESGASTREALRRANPVLRLASHLANGAKHFVVFSHIDSVKSPHGVEIRCGPSGAQTRFLAIEVNDDARALFDSERPLVIDAANKVCQFWREHFAANRLFK